MCRTETSRAWVGRGLCTGKASAQHKVTVVFILNSQLPQKQILSRCKIVPSHFLHQLGPVGLPKYFLVNGVFRSEIVENMGNILGSLSSWHLENTFLYAAVHSNQNGTKLQ